MIEKEPDGRISEITKTWCEGIWKGRYHLKAPWSGKEAKLLQKTLKWLDSNYIHKEDAKKELLDALGRYIEDKDRYYSEDRHPFSKFASKPEKWCVVYKERKKVIEEKKIEIPKQTWEEFYEWAARNPKQAIRGFAKTAGLLKQRNPEKYSEVKTYLLDLVGKAQAIAWAKEPAGPHALA